MSEFISKFLCKCLLFIPPGALNASVRACKPLQLTFEDSLAKEFLPRKIEFTESEILSGNCRGEVA